MDGQWIWTKWDSFDSDLEWSTSFPSSADGHDYVFLDGANSFLLANNDQNHNALPLCERGSIDNDSLHKMYLLLLVIY